MTLLVSFGFAILVFGVRIQGSVLGFLGVAIACALMAATFGLLIAALGKTPAATRGVTTLAVLMMVMLGGAWVPTFIFPAWLQQAHGHRARALGSGRPGRHDVARHRPQRRRDADAGPARVRRAVRRRRGPAVSVGRGLESWKYEVRSIEVRSRITRMVEHLVRVAAIRRALFSRSFPCSSPLSPVRPTRRSRPVPNSFTTARSSSTRTTTRRSGWSFDKAFDIGGAQQERQHRHSADARGRARRAVLLHLGAERRHRARPP